MLVNAHYLREGGRGSDVNVIIYEREGGVVMLMSLFTRGREG